MARFAQLLRRTAGLMRPPVEGDVAGVPAHLLTQAEVVFAGKKVLRTPARTVTPADFASGEVERLSGALLATMRAHEGLGLAAPQLGKSLRIFVGEVTADALKFMGRPASQRLDACVFVNPTLRVVPGARTLTEREACLSVPGASAIVSRADSVEITALDVKGKVFTRTLSGFPASLVQHELDHLNGILFVDRMFPRTYACILDSDMPEDWQKRLPL